MNKPSIGRVVHFWPDHPVDETDLAKPFPMVIAFVHNECMVNLGGWDHNGDHTSATSVPLLRDGDLIPRGGFYAVWPQHASVVSVKPDAPVQTRVMSPEHVSTDAVARWGGAPPDGKAFIPAAVEAEGMWEKHQPPEGWQCGKSTDPTP
jgi:hypothetical protein